MRIGCMASSYLPLLDVEEKATRCYLTPYTLSMPSPPLSHRMRTMPSSIVFVMLLGRLAHPHSVSGTMEQLYGYDRTQITKWTNHMLEYLFNEWAFLLELNETRLAEKMNEGLCSPPNPSKSKNPSKSFLRGLLFEGFVDVCSMLFEGFEEQSKPCKKQKAHEAHLYAPLPSLTEAHGHCLEWERVRHRPACVCGHARVAADFFGQRKVAHRSPPPIGP